MISDLDIYRAPKLLIDRHSGDAALNAASRADLLLEEEDVEGATRVAVYPCVDRGDATAETT